MDFELDKEKYFAILRKDGLSAAITALHKDMERLEFDCFEGQEGYKPEAFEKLSEWREFSRELWKIQMSNPHGL